MSVPNPLIIDAQVVAQTNVVQADALGDGAVNAETLTDNRPMPHITIGEVQTLATGEDATATMTGTYVNPVLNLGLPRGERGIQGEQGIQGNPGRDGIDGTSAGFGTPTASASSLPAGSSPTVSVSASGQDTEKVFSFSFGIPKGDKGDTGETGATGQTGATGAAAGFGTPTASASTLQPTDSATVSVTASGADTAKVFDFSFGIPKGEQGVQGEPGQDYVLTQQDKDDIADIVGADIPYAAAASTDTTRAALKTAGIMYGEVDNTSTSTKFTATIPGITSYYHGLIIFLKNGVVTSASGFTININGLGAKPSYSNMSAATADTTLFNTNYTMLFIYDENRIEGGCWVCYRGYNSDTNTIGYQLRTNSISLPTVSKTRYYRLLFTNATNDKWVPANTEYDNSATSKKTVNQTAINPFGRIVYLGNSTSYAANANVTATAVWDQYAHALGYSFNRTGAALTLTSQKPVYVKCAPQADGSAIMDSTEPIVQALPSTDDGKIYIYLGIAYSATNIELVINHPVYYYKNGAIRLWTGPV